MAGPYTGTWLQNIIDQTGYTGATRWGTGVNDVHRKAGVGPNIRQNATLSIPPVKTPGGETTEVIAEDYSWQAVDNPDPNLESYNVTPATTWGDNDQTGTADRPSWGHEIGDEFSPINGGGLPNPQQSGRPVFPMRGRAQNATNSDFPGWDTSGESIRDQSRGNIATSAARELPGEDGPQGWLNKRGNGIIPDARTSDDSTIFMQTSMTQRYKSRAGSQNAGSQSTFKQPIDSRVTYQKLKRFAAPNSSRFWDMLPFQQFDVLRPFLSRQAGTGYREWMHSNDMYVSEPVQREPAPDPPLGFIAGEQVQPYPAQQDEVYDFMGGFWNAY